MTQTQKLVMGNWKMNGSLKQTRELLFQLQERMEAENIQHDHVVVFPSFCHSMFVLSRLAELGWNLGAQDCSVHTDGPFTGDTSAKMLKDLGCSHVLAGHSERRQSYGETNAIVRQKISRALEAGLMPVLCIGETQHEHESGQTLHVIENQLYNSIPEQIGDNQIIIAYEPVWAIGTGKVADVNDIQFAHQHIRNLLSQKDPILARAPIIYGGSVNSKNAALILDLDCVDGVLVGGASLKADDFTDIIKHSLRH